MKPHSVVPFHRYGPVYSINLDTGAITKVEPAPERVPRVVEVVRNGARSFEWDEAAEVGIPIRVS
jgi:hypothetical protein